MALWSVLTCGHETYINLGHYTFQDLVQLIYMLVRIAGHVGPINTHHMQSISYLAVHHHAYFEQDQASIARYDYYDKTSNGWKDGSSLKKPDMGPTPKVLDSQPSRSP